MKLRGEEDFDSHAEALRRIAECKATQAEALDLSGLYLTEFPEEALELGWLRRLKIRLQDTSKRGGNHSISLPADLTRRLPVTCHG